MKIEAVKTRSVTAARIVEVSDGPILGERRRFRVERVHVTYLWSAKEHRWNVQHIELSGPVVKKDGTNGLTTGTKRVWLADAGEPYTEFRRIAANLAPTGDPALPGVLDA